MNAKDLLFRLEYLALVVAWLVRSLRDFPGYQEFKKKSGTDESGKRAIPS